MNDNGGLESDEKTNYIRRNEHGIYLLALYPGHVKLLPYLLSSSLPYIWLRNHRPNRMQSWWETLLPLSQVSAPKRVVARGVTFDLLLDYQDFMVWLDDFEHDGIELYQSSKPVPDTLDVDRISQEARFKVLLQNGIMTAFFLPHANEVALFWSSELSVVEKALSFSLVRDAALCND